MTEKCTSCGREFRLDDSLCGRCGAKRSSGGQPASPSPSMSVSSVPKKRPPVAIFIGLALLLGVVPLAFMGIFGDGSVEGQMAVSGSPHGEWTFVPTGCASMQPYGQMGANVHADGHNDGAVYVTLDHATGHKVELEVPGSCQNADGTDCTVFEVPRESCETFEATVDYTNTTVNDVRLVQGQVQLDCTFEDGTRVQGSITFDDC